MPTAMLIDALRDPMLRESDGDLFGAHPAGDVSAELAQILDSAVGPASSTPDYTRYSVWRPRICCC